MFAKLKKCCIIKLIIQTGAYDLESKKIKNDNPHKNHRSRIRETFRKAGVDGMPDHNLLELLLFYSIPRKDTNELAHKLITEFGSLSRVFDATYEQLLDVEGMGESSALLISMIPGICRRYIEGKSKGKINLSDPKEAQNYLKDKFYGCKTEIFYILCLDSSGNLINCCKLGEGTPGTVLVDKRNVMQTAFRNDADKIILAHNHPKGVCAPSREDLELTNEFSTMLSSVGIRVVDHIIVAGNETLSLASVEKFRLLFR